jgi:hypothetical protein
MPLEPRLTLREGAQVIVKKNMPELGLVNGSLRICGEVTKEHVLIDGNEIKKERSDQKEKKFVVVGTLCLLRAHIFL